MARGKHKKTKAAKDRAALEKAIVQARADLAREESLLDSARQEASRSESARLDLSLAVDERNAACATEIRRTGRALEDVSEALRGSAENHRLLAKGWDRYLGELFAASGGAVEVQELLLSIISGDPAAMVSSGIQKAGISAEAAEKIQMVRGERRRTGRRLTPEQQSRMEQVFGIYKAKDEGEESAIAARMRALPRPLVDLATLSHGPTAVALGVVEDVPVRDQSKMAHPEIPSSPAHVLTAAARDLLATSYGPEELLDRWSVPLIAQYRDVVPTTQITGPEVIPAFPSPTDAVALRSWYAASGWGLWLRGEQDTGRHHRRITVAAESSVAYWLPPGHTGAYLDSDPMPESDVEDLRLPYPSVFVSLADPIALKASGGSAEQGVTEHLAWLDEAARYMTAMKEGRERTLLSLATGGFNRPLLDIATVLRHWDLRIEGAVLLGDALGRMDDLFAWCVAIVGPGGQILTRIMLPSSLSTTAYRQQVLSLAAVVAWGDWHEPRLAVEDPEHGSHSGDGHPPVDSGQSTVRILNVKAARRQHEQNSGEAGTGHSVAPHIRRGHWRRQRYGTGRSLIRRVRIAPTLVNAANGEMSARVYALPRVGTGE